MPPIDEFSYTTNSANTLQQSLEPIAVVADPILDPKNGMPVIAKVARPKWKPNKAMLWIGLSLLIMTTLAVLLILLVSVSRQNEAVIETAKQQEYPNTEIPLTDLTDGKPLTLGQLSQVDVSGRITVNGTLILTPGEAPAEPVPGEMYFSQQSQKVYYYDGTSFNQLASSGENSFSFGGISGQVVLGSGLSMNGNVLSGTNNGITVVSGTANQINVIVNGGTATLMLPQDIAVSSSPTFAGLQLNGPLNISNGNAVLSATAGGFKTTIGVTTPTANRLISLPNSDGTLCIQGSAACGFMLSGTSGNYVSFSSATAQEDTTANSSIFINKTNASGNILQLQKGGADVLTLNNAGDLTVQNTTIAAGKSLTVIGGNTASRPASPTEGMVYFDTDTDKLLTYSNGKWQADRSTATKIVAASNSSQAVKDGADYVVTGNAEDEINAALTAAAGGKVYLAEGTYVAGATILIPNNTTLAGAGRGTLVELADLDAAENLIESSDTASGTGVVIRDLRIDGRDDLNTVGGQNGIVLGGMGDAPTRPGAVITGVWVENFMASGIIIGGGSDYNTVSNSTISGTGYAGVMVGFACSHNTIIGNLIKDNSLSGIFIGISDGTTVSGNTISNNNTGIALGTANKSAITGNVILGSSSTGIYIDNSTENTVSANQISDSGGSLSNGGILLISTTRNNYITGNNISDTACTNSCYAIYVTDANSSNNYLSGNRFSSTPGTATIFDAGTGTVFANQSRAENGGRLTVRNPASTEAFQIQNFDSVNLFNIDTTNTTNLISRYSSFETNTSGWAAMGGATISTNNVYRWNGQQSMAINTSATTGDGVKFNYPLLPSTQYTFSMYATSSTFMTGSNLVVGYSNSTATANISCTTAQLNQHWRRYVCTFTTSASLSGTQYLFVGQNDTTARDMFIDAVQLELSATANTYNPGGSIDLNGLIDTPLLVKTGVPIRLGDTAQILSGSSDSISLQSTNYGVTLNIGGQANGNQFQIRNGGTGQAIIDTSMGNYNSESLRIIGGRNNREGTLMIAIAADTKSTLALRSVTAQTGDLLQLQNDTGVATSGFNASGNLFVGTTAGPNKISVNTLTTTDSLAQVAISTGATTNKGLVVQGVAGQTANLQEWQTSTGSLGSYVESDGSMVVSSSPSSNCLGGGASKYTQVNAGSIVLCSVGGYIQNTIASRANDQLTFGAGDGGNFSGVRVVGVDDGNNPGNYANLVVRQGGSSTNQAFQVQNSVGTVLSGFNASGNLFVGTTAAPNKINVNTLTTADNLAQVAISTGATTNKGLVIQGQAGQSASLVEFQNSSGEILSKVNTNGSFVVFSPGYSAEMASLGNSNLTLGYGGASTGVIVLKRIGSGLDVALRASISQTASRNIYLPDEDGSICIQGSANCGFAPSATNGYVQLAPASAQADATNNSSLFINKTSGTGNILQLQKAGADVLTLNNSGDLTVQNTTIAAGKTLTVIGGNSASRPASPTEGMVYFDTDTDKLLTYSNGKWQADRSTATKIVAASNSSQAIKDSADYVVSGNAEDEINAALTAAAGGKVYLAEGTYVAGATILIPNDTTLTGIGNGTVIELADLDADENLIENSNTSSGKGVIIQYLTLNGRKDLNTAGIQSGIYFNNVGRDGSLSGGAVIGTSIVNFRNEGISTYISDYSKIVDNIIKSNNGIGIYFFASNYNNVTGNSSFSNNTGYYYVFSSQNSMSGNYANSNSGIGYYLSHFHGSTVIGNRAASNGTGLYSDNSANNNVSNNYFGNNSDSGINLGPGSTYNTVSGNELYDNGGATSNSAIYLSHTADSNIITGNKITDTAATTSNYAIYINNISNDSNYLSNNQFSSTPGTSTINDQGIGTVFANQPMAENGMNLLNRSTNSTNAFAIQGTNKVNILNVDTTNGELEVGSYNAGVNSVNGKLVVNNSTNGNTVTIQSGATVSSYSLTLPTTAGSAGECLKNSATAGTLTFGTCGSGTPTLQGAYDAGVAGDQVIALSTANDSIIVRNPSSGGTDSGYVLTVDQLATGAVGGLDIQSAGSGNLLRIRDTTATAQDVLVVADGGAIMLRNQLNSTAALQVQNAVGANIFTINTVSNQIDIFGSATLNQVAAPAIAPSAAINPAVGNLNGGYYYEVTYVTASGETSAPSAYSAQVNPVNQRVDLTNIPISSNPLVIARKIYRTYANSGGPNNLGILLYHVATINDNTTTTYTDNTADGSLGGIIPQDNSTAVVNLGSSRILSMGGLGNNTWVGINSGATNTGGFRNTGLGALSLDSNTTGFLGTALGYGTLTSNTTGAYNTAVGGMSLISNTTGWENTAVGSQALLSNTTGSNNTASGAGALYENTTGSNNTASGEHALSRNNTGSYNTAYGTQALSSLRTLSGTITNTINNGGFAQFTTSSTSYLVPGSTITISGTTNYNGSRTILSIDSGTTFTINTSYSVASPSGTWTAGTDSNTAVGYNAGSGTGLYYAAAGNSLFGYQAGDNLQTGANYNSLFGYSAGSGITTGTNNVLMGYNAGTSLTSGSNNILIGQNVQAPSATGSNQLQIGAGLSGDLATGTLAVKSIVNSTNSFQVQNSSASSLLSVDTINNRVLINASSTVMSPPAGLNASAASVGSGSLALTTTYYYKVTALDSSGGETTPSIGASATTNARRIINLYWSPVLGAAGYKIYRGTSSGNEVYLSTVFYNYTTISPYQDTGVIAPGTESSPTSNSAYTSINNSNSNQQLIVGGNGTPTGQVYISGTIPGTTNKNGLATPGAPTITNQGTTGAGLYIYAITAVTGGKETYLSTMAYTSTGNATLSGINYNQISWGSVAGASSYNVYRLRQSNAVSGIGLIGNTGGTTLNDIGQVSTAIPPTAAIGSSPGAGENTNTAYRMVQQGNYLYAHVYPTLIIYDISNPSNPVTLSTTAVAANGGPFAVVGRYLYFASLGGIRTYDVSNPAAPTLVASISPFVSVTAVTARGKYLYISGQTQPGSQGAFFIVDISNPLKPVIVGSLTGFTSNAQDIYLRGNYAFTHLSSCRAIDISNPTTPTIVATLSTPYCSKDGMSGAGRYSYTVNGPWLYTHDNINPTTPVLTNSLSLGSILGSASADSVRKLATNGRYVYIVNDTTYTMQIIDVANPYDAKIIGNVSTGSMPYNIAVKGRYAYIQTQLNMLVFDLGGAYIQQIEVGGAEIGSLFVSNAAQFDNDASIRGGLSIGQGLNVTNDVGISGGLTARGLTVLQGSTVLGGGLSGGFVLNSLAIPPAPVVSFLGTSGTTTYSYAITAINASGETIPSVNGSTNVGSAVISIFDFNQISWAPVTGAVSYNIYRTVSGGTPSTTGLIGNTTGTRFEDKGLAATTPVPNSNSTANVTFNSNNFLIKSPTDNSTVFRIQNSAGANVLVADTANLRVYVGDSAADGTGVTLVIDTKNTAGDPTGVDGAMYYNSNFKQFRCYANGSWRGCNSPLVAANTSVPVGNTVANTTAQTDFASNYSMPADSCTPGKVYRVTAYGVYGSAAAPGNLTIRAKLGTTAIGATAAAAPNGSLTDRGWKMDYVITCITSGATGSVEGQGETRLSSSTTTADIREMTNTATVTVDTTTAQTLQLSAEWATADPSNTITLRQLIIEEL